MTRCQTDHFVFYIHSDDKWILLVVYFDDIILIGNDVKGIEEQEHFHFQVVSFTLKIWVNLDIFFGIEVAQSVGGISLSHRKYTSDLLKDTGFLGYKPVDTPMDPNQNMMIV